jgi:hypothetical protein
MNSEPCIPRRGTLKNGNPPGNPWSAPRCGAKSRRTGLPCRGPAVHGKRRCRFHSGLSTGPRTPEGLARTRRANWKHGAYSQQARQTRRDLRAATRMLNALLGRVR